MEIGSGIIRLLAEVVDGKGWWPEQRGAKGRTGQGRIRSIGLGVVGSGRQGSVGRRWTIWIGVVSFGYAFVYGYGGLL